MEFKKEAPTPEAYNDLRLRSKIGGPKPLAKARQALQNSLYVVSVYDGESLIGLGRIIGDGAVSFAVTDVMVAEEYQRQGIGHMIMQHLDAWFAKHTDITSYIMLIANKPADRLYRKYGFEDVGEMKIGMLRKHSI